MKDRAPKIIRVGVPSDSLRLVFDSKHIYYTSQFEINLVESTLKVWTNSPDLKDAVQKHYALMFKPTNITLPTIAINLAYTLWSFKECLIFGRVIKDNEPEIVTFMFKDYSITEITG